MLRFCRMFGIIFVEAQFWFIGIFGVGSAAVMELTGLGLPWRHFWMNIIFGGTMGAVLLGLMVAVADAYFYSVLKNTHNISDPRVNYSDTILLSCSLDDAGEIVRSALGKFGARDVKADLEESVIRARKPFSFKTSGEKLTVRMEEDGENVRLTVGSRPRWRTTITDLCQNAMNVARLLEIIKSTSVQ